MTGLGIRIHQFHYSVRRYDAITNQMRLIQKSLFDIGIGGDIFASEIGNNPGYLVKPFQRQSAWGCDLFLIHHSQGNPALKKLLQLDVPKALVYHNITPASFFRHDLYIARLCETGRSQLDILKNVTVHAFADSKYNADELKKIGFRKISLLPLVDMESRRRQFPPSETRNFRRFLFVGKCTPHKNQALLIKTFFYLKKLLKSPCVLTLAGASDPLYGDYLRLLAKTLGISADVERIKTITDSDLAKLYRNSDAFLCASLHEGFCIPLVEAVMAKIPIFALTNTAITETLGKAGVQIRSEEPAVIAEIIARVFQNSKILETVLKSQEERSLQLEQEQSSEQIQKRIVDLISHIVGPHRLRQHSPSYV